MKLSHQNINKGFTLVELLVVIAIIATLVGVSAPIILRQIDKGKEVEAGQMLKDIQTAIEEYEKDYSILPVASQAASVTDPTSDVTLSPTEQNDLFNILSTRNVFGQNENEKVYFEPKLAKDPTTDPRSGVTLSSNAITGLFDPWGNNYILRIDYDLNEELTLDADFGSHSGDVLRNTKIAVASKGRDGILDHKNDITSWPQQP